jgi:hypothetical protein
MISSVWDETWGILSPFCPGCDIVETPGMPPPARVTCNSKRRLNNPHCGGRAGDQRPGSNIILFRVAGSQSAEEALLCLRVSPSSEAEDFQSRTPVQTAPIFQGDVSEFASPTGCELASRDSILGQGEYRYLYLHHHCVPNDSNAYPAQGVPGGSFTGGKAVEAWKWSFGYIQRRH